MKTWTDIAFEYFVEGESPVCPACGSTKIEIAQRSHGDRIWVDFVCEECKSTDHFDGFKTQNRGRT